MQSESRARMNTGPVAVVIKVESLCLRPIHQINSFLCLWMPTNPEDLALHILTGPARTSTARSWLYQLAMCFEKENLKPQTLFTWLWRLLLLSLSKRQSQSFSELPSPARSTITECKLKRFLSYNYHERIFLGGACTSQLNKLVVSTL